ncbi:hypothetical protein [Undibacterium danionis]|uniref:Uncharacterized protein n=1 Tax=Undibacterium danionis TaxID=1812100 RepID=A0ABV6IC19_9BURK
MIEMTKRIRDLEVSEHLRTLTHERFGTRGRFTLLERASGIGASKWKNFYYKKQEATTEMIAFWIEKYPEDESFLMTGKIPPRKDGYPFGTIPPHVRQTETISDRLNWVIVEWTSPRGAALFEYLEERSKHQIAAEEWKKTVLGEQAPTAAMVEIVCKARPYFAAWITCGSEIDSYDQVDPTCTRSIKTWRSNLLKQLMSAPSEDPEK